MNLGPLKLYAVTKGIGWLKKIILPNWELFYCPRGLPIQAGGFKHLYNTIHYMP
jgi:hypothetical protein